MVAIRRRGRAAISAVGVRTSRHRQPAALPARPSHGGPARCAATCRNLIDLAWSRKITPGKVFDLTLPLEQVAEGQ